MRDFFAQQDRARASTRLLVFLFLLGVVSVVAITLLLVLLFFPDPFLVSGDARQLGQSLPSPDQLNWPLLGTVGALFVAFLCFLSLVRTITLSVGGGTAVAESLGGRLVQPMTDDPDEKRFVNVVEEMAIASGMPVPQIYVLDGDEGINAFAAGTSINRAAVAVTRGTLQRLNRDELQGVVAHEFSHILNGDMVLHLRIIGVLFGIVFLREAGYFLFRGLSSGRSSSSSSKRSNSTSHLALFGLAVWLLGSIGYVFGLLIKAAVSRQREYLADAAAVQFTRNPLGIGGALQKIATYGSSVSSPRASETNHFFLANGAKGFFSFASHPPLQERIARILGEEAAKQRAEGEAPTNPYAAEMRAMGLGATAAPTTIPAPDKVVAQAGTRAEPVAGQKLGGLPTMLVEAAHETSTARALVCLLLVPSGRLSHEAEKLLVERSGADLAQETLRLCERHGPVGVAHRLPALELALPSLRQMSEPQRKTFLSTIKGLVELDGKIELFELLLWRLVRHTLQPRGTETNDEPQTNDAKAAARIVIAAVAQADGKDAADALAAYRAGVERLYGRAILPDTIPLCGTAQLSAALKKLEKVKGSLREATLEACSLAAATDGTLQMTELEIVRTTALLLGVCIPPTALRT